MDKKELAKMIDHTLLKPEANYEQIVKLCKEALEYGFASVCINPCYVNAAYQLLKGSDVKVCTVVGFPLGAATSETKTFEAVQAVNRGASEIDMVINVGYLKSGNHDYVEEDIKTLVNKINGRALVKVIIETCLLNDEEKIIACKLAKKAGAHFVKTSTGFNMSGATSEDVALMYDAVSPNLKVKASGGIRTYEDAIKMINAGASRIGASSSIKIINKK
ncbi:deoxyribose-phosphate aldolase [Clostridium kluyveri]|uniref:Deoxyribose-phosphate aldolase n=2 Tax=Clostridium kluyveri TaxID=1534 RepID=DEOC_CLOK5|nr:deoxyribose-phosphate aldolase [Clostridium kluyveri]A5N0Z3.1 RecName: Full=Deoxyribose-phosphate aldolase; Short=DERA; AltName: Full=2-deoxy-D-ribose 5-phosphate aldolase; AltName: Full=Phosphodeoxyriboaldolase; Short=Deoxyriboaldolase [Clostridium kluyveri DSM 555]B9E4U5.1 RecName: Full=Deoxyribose-phosphate aldolase; Short=DERA; AltName: Full=2-deoxy-D-ribose 5-phosphate aldolase; AltName: Full=Phosphodeoxyriboaldolase; Short=Deoxyriboaldolase [Clostridium kluyveri NBRC 12016]EDK34789.1 De